MPTQKKIDSVGNLIEKLARARAIVLTDYHGLTHRQLEDLKKAVKKAAGDFIIVKNTLLKIASEKAGPPQIKDLTSNLSGPTALLLSYQDELLPLREVARFLKQFQLPVLKSGLLENKLLTGEELVAIAALPAKEVLIGQLLGQLNSPLARLHYALTWNLQKLVLTLKAVEKSKIKS